MDYKSAYYDLLNEFNAILDSSDDGIHSFLWKNIFSYNIWFNDDASVLLTAKDRFNIGFYTSKYHYLMKFN